MLFAFVLLRVVFGAEGGLLEALRGIEGVEDVYLVEGVYNVIARVKAKTMDGLREITWSIRKLDGGHIRSGFGSDGRTCGLGVVIEQVFM